MLGSSESWEPQQAPRRWHSRAGGGAVHSIKSGHMQCSKKSCAGLYMRAMAIFEVMLTLTFPSLRNGPRCAPIAAFSLTCVPAGNVARDGASGLASRDLAA